MMEGTAGTMLVGYSGRWAPQGYSAGGPHGADCDTFWSSYKIQVQTPNRIEIIFLAANFVS